MEKIIVNLFVVDSFYRSLGVKTSHLPDLPRCKNLLIFLCFAPFVFLGSIVLLCFHSSTSLMSFTNCYTKVKPIYLCWFLLLLLLFLILSFIKAVKKF